MSHNAKRSIYPLPSCFHTVFVPTSHMQVLSLLGNKGVVQLGLWSTVDEQLHLTSWQWFNKAKTKWDFSHTLPVLVLPFGSLNNKRCCCSHPLPWAASSQKWQRSSCQTFENRLHNSLAVIMVIKRQIFLCTRETIKETLSFFCSVRILCVSKKSESRSSTEGSLERSEKPNLQVPQLSVLLFFVLS